MNKLIVVSVLFLVASSFFIYNCLDIDKADGENFKEDISSYNIYNRHDCKQIQNDEEYNKCINFYLSKTPYKLGEDIVSIRRTS